MKRIVFLLSTFALLLLLAWGTGKTSASETAVSQSIPSGWNAIGRSLTTNGINNSTRVANRPEVFVDHNDNLYVAWEEQISLAQQEIYLLRWDGDSWDELGDSASDNGVSNLGRYAENADVVVHTDGTVYVSWQSPNSDGAMRVYVRKWNGSYWSAIGGSTNDDGISTGLFHAANPTMAVDENGVLYAAYNGTEKEDGYAEIYIRKFSGSSWSNVGSGSSSGGGISNTTNDRSYAPSIALDSQNQPYVAWTEDRSPDAEIYLRYWNGSNWAEIGSSGSGNGLSNSTDKALEPFLAISDSDVPHVSWHNIVDGDRQIYIRRWERNAWREIGTGSATGGGISNTSDDSLKSQMHILSDDYIYVTWQDWGSTNLSDVYIRRWNGSFWEEVGSGSASGGGISDTSPRSIHPTIGVDSSNKIYLIWADTNSGNNPTEGTVFGRSYQNAPCYTLSRTHTGDGSDPVASSNNSTGCFLGDYVAGELIYLTASPDDGWEVSGWNNTNNDGSTSTANQVTMPAADLTVRVDYEQSCYPLTLTHSGNGADPVASPTKSAGCGTGYYTFGELIDLTAAPANGSQVASWENSNNDGSTSTSNSVTMPSSAVTVQVNYEPIQDDGCYLFVAAHEGEGKTPAVTPSSSTGCSGDGRFKPNETIILVAEPDDGWKVKAWDGTDDNSSSSKVNLVTMPARNAVAIVIYEPVCYGLTLTYTGVGEKPLASSSLSSCSSGKYPPGELVSLTAVPHSGWSIERWINTNNDISTEPNNTVTMPDRDLTITVVYREVDRTYASYLPFVNSPGAVVYFPGPEEQEDNDLFGTANGPLESGKPYQGRPNDEYDVFYIEPVRSGNIRITVGNLPNSQITQLQLYSDNASGNMLLDREFQPNNGVLELNYTITQARKYYIVVFRDPAQLSNTPYNLTVTYPAP